MTEMAVTTDKGDVVTGSHSSSGVFITLDVVGLKLTC